MRARSRRAQHVLYGGYADNVRRRRRPQAEQPPVVAKLRPHLPWCNASEPHLHSSSSRARNNWWTEAMNLRADILQKAARMRADVAQSLLPQSGGDPQVASYLIHVALECALKARLLRAAGMNTLHELANTMKGDDLRELFFGRTGHQLTRLAAKAGLQRLL